MDSTAISNTPVTLLTLLSEVRAHCELNKVHSLEAVHKLFENAVRDCKRPTAGSNPSFAFFGDWIARTSGLIRCDQGKWQRLSLDCWHIVGELQSDDCEAYFLFWKLFEEFCKLDERVVAATGYHSVSETDELPMRCELRQLYPDTGVYCRCHFRSDDKHLAVRIVNYGFFESLEVAMPIVEVEAHVASSEWQFMNGMSKEAGA